MQNKTFTFLILEEDRRMAPGEARFQAVVEGDFSRIVELLFKVERRGDDLVFVPRFVP